MANKKRRNKKRPNKTKKESGGFKTWLAIIIGVIIIIILAVVLINIRLPIIERTALKVNHETITVEEFNKGYERLSEAYKETFGKKGYLEELINQRLLLQEAAAMNITVTEREINNSIYLFMVNNLMNMTELEDILAAKGMTIDDLREVYREKLLIDKLLEDKFIDINITDEEIQDYYFENIDSFKEPEKVKVRHILVRINQNRTEPQALDLINEVKDKFEEGEDFCDLVREYSVDVGSLDTCGEYTFSKGTMVPEFEDASFNLSINETTIARTMYGYHLIQLLDKIPEKTLSLEETSDDIKAILEVQEKQIIYNEFVQELRNKAEIEIYIEVEGEIIIEEELEENITEEVEEEEEIEENITEEGEEEEIEEVEEVEEIEEEEIEEGIVIDLTEFAKCLGEKDTILYTYGKKYQNQIDMFKGNFDPYLQFVDCMVEDYPELQKEVCEQANIKGYPTWVIEGTQYKGEQTLFSLSRLSGCELA